MWREARYPAIFGRDDSGMMSRYTRTVMTALLTTVLLLPALALAQDEADAEAKKIWEHTADLSYVLTSGNSESSTLGFSWKSLATWERTSLEIIAGGIRAQNTAVTRTATGTPPVVTESSTTATTAENYFFGGRYDRKITERFLWYAGLGWLRNEFAGIKDRYTASGGVANAWRDDDHMKFKTSYGLSYTDQTDLVTVPGADTSFVGLRLAYAYEHNLGSVTTFNSDLVYNGNLEESSNWYANWLNSVTVAMSAKLALKASLLFLYNNQPALALVPLFDAPEGTPDPGGPIPVPLDELDTIFTTSLVIKF